MLQARSKCSWEGSFDLPSRHGYETTTRQARAEGEPSPSKSNKVRPSRRRSSESVASSPLIDLHDRGRRPYVWDSVSGFTNKRADATSRAAATCKPHPAGGWTWGRAALLALGLGETSKGRRCTEVRPTQHDGRKSRALDQEGLGECEWREGHAGPGHAVVRTSPPSTESSNSRSTRGKCPSE